MNYSNDYINKLIDLEIDFSDKLSLKYHYPDNITHLLYIIIPAFILKYGYEHKTLIEDAFNNIPIMIHDTQNKVYQAYYYSKPIKKGSDIVTEKGIILSNYKNISLMQLLDNLIHEFNHAINSLQNEVIIDSFIKIRTGLVYNYFDINTLTFIKQSPEIVIEEVINTKQTELIIDIIYSFFDCDIKNIIVSNTIYSINRSIDINYHSNSYFLESYVCKRLLQNKTFISTLENLRFVGQVSDFSLFFDSITGKENSFLTLANCLKESLQLQNDYIKAKWFKRRILKKIKSVNKISLTIVDNFDNNTIYK